MSHISAARCSRLALGRPNPDSWFANAYFACLASGFTPPPHPCHPDGCLIDGFNAVIDCVKIGADENVFGIICGQKFTPRLN